MMPEAARLAVGLLTVVPVGTVRAVDRELFVRAMPWVLPVGALLGVGAALVLVAAERIGLDPLTASILAVGSLAALTRGLHLDGLADTADGLGSRRPAEQALAVMRASDIGPFGVVVLVLVLLLQVAALGDASWPGLVVAVVVGRLSILVCCSGGIPAARADGLGVLVAGSVSRPLLIVAVAVVTTGAAAGTGWAGVLAVLIGLTVTVVLVRHCVRRLGGITGDVIGAAVELSTTGALLLFASTAANGAS
jgi:adenosylcobinamide-GDP ribazoletransferase